MHKEATNKKLVPALRFPEFKNAGEWGKKPLNEILDYERPDNYIVSNTDYVKDGTPVLTANKSFILGYTNEKDGICNNIPAIIFDDFTVDKKYVDFPFKVKSSAIKILRSKTDDSLKFVFEVMNLIKYDAKEHKRYYISEYQNLKILIPSPTEQQKIADCLSSLDELIDAESQKLDALKEHKKGMMQQLFPAEGEKLPKLRFAGFDREWEETTIENFAPLQRGFDLPISTIIDGIYPVVFSNGILKYHNEYKAKGPGVVTGRSGTIGTLTYVEDDYWPHNTSLWVTDFKGNMPKYVYYFYQNFNIERFSTRAGVPTLNRNDVHIQKCYMPKPAEQQKIADCLSAIDELITTQTQKIEQLKDHKKGLMQQLFPSPNE